MTQAKPSAFRSLRNPNFRLWFAGGLVSNIGQWMQRVAQDWLVLTVLTRHDAAALGVVIACQFGPQLVLLPWVGSAVDKFDRRRLLFVTQAAMALLGTGLAVLTLGGWVELWHVYLFAVTFGIAAAFDGPARQTFVSDMVGEDDLANAVALNSTSVNASRMIGPAIAGLLISVIGIGWVFALNAASFLAVLLSLVLMQRQALHAPGRSDGERGTFLEGLRYVRSQPEIVALLAMMFVFGAFGLNYPVYISTMAASVFKLDAQGFGLLTSSLAVGSIAGALVAARRGRPTVRIIGIAAVVFGCAYAAAAVMPNALLFGAALVIVGAASQTVTTSTNSLVQISTHPNMRGRVMALLFTVMLGGQPIGAPVVGWVANMFGPRYAVLLGAAAGAFTALVAWWHVRRARRAMSAEPCAGSDTIAKGDCVSGGELAEEDLR